MMVAMESTDRLRIEPASVAWLEALAEGDDVFAARFAIAVEPGWAVFPETIAFALEGARAAPPEWGVHLFFDALDGALVGNGGWKGPPVDGAAELGYAVAEGRRNRGFATAAVQELVRRARGEGVRVAVAHTLAQVSASTTVLSRCGFAYVDDVIDPDDGPLWRWELPLDA